MNSINSKMLREMFVSGANNLQNNKDLIDKLNVFPVPDGDTGTNMSLTIASAIRELSKLGDVSLSEVGKTLSKGSLMGARGNSGVILSQIIRGFSKSIEGKTELGVLDLAKALKHGSDIAYKAVIKPVEGTILTVVRESAEYAMKLAKREESIENFMLKVYEESEESLKRTPELLKNLKDAGVVDSGGKGLVCMYEGMYKTLIGESIQFSEKQVDLSSVQEISTGNTEPDNIEFGYCTEFILESNKITSDEMKDIMLNYGDSLVVVGFEGVVKVHVHTNDPGLVLQEALNFGQLVTIKVENMRLQHENIILDEEKEKEAEEIKKYGFITTSMGEGIETLFKEFGVDKVIKGGQTMNPSTEDFLKAIEDLKAENIFIFPNNGNIIMAANQAKEISEKNIIVIPTKNIPQALSCLVTFNLDSDVKENEDAFNEALLGVQAGEITYAVRDTLMDGKEIKEGDIIGLGAKKLISSGNDIEDVTESVVNTLVDEDSAIVTIFYGEDVEKEKAEKFAEKIESKFGDVDVELYYGGQPLYYYLVSVE